DVQRVGDGRVERGDAEVAKHHRLAGRVAGRGWDDHRADPGGGVVDAEAAGEQAVAGRVLEDVVLGDAAGHQSSAAHVSPEIEVDPGVRHDGRLAGGAAGGVDPDDLAAGHGQHAERVLVPEVGLGGERQEGEVVVGSQDGRVDAVEAAVERV